MKKFLAKILLVALAVGCLFYIVYFILYPHPVSIVYQKHDRLTSVDSPKFVFTGGSNGLFGIDSAYLQKEINMSVVDYSIQAGLPISFYIREIEPTLKPGDTVAFILEYSFYYGDVSDSSIASIIESYPMGIPSLLPEYWPGTPRYLKKIFENQYFRFQHRADKPKETIHNYNEFGDATYMLDFHEKIFQDNEHGKISGIEKIDQSVIDQINGFAKRANEKGAHVVVFFPSIRRSQFDQYTKNADELYMYLTDHLECKILGKPEDYVFDDIYIADTSYHLNREGRKIRTEKMIDALQKSGILPGD